MRRERLLNFQVVKYLLCAFIALGVAIFGLILSLPPTDVSFYQWYPSYLKSLATFQSSSFDQIRFNGIDVALDRSFTPIELKLQSDHKVSILLPKRWKSNRIAAGSQILLSIGDQTPFPVTITCNSLVLNYTTALNQFGNNVITYSVSDIKVPCQFITKYGLSYYIFVEQDPLLVLGQQSGWNLDFFSMSGYSSSLRTIGLVFLTIPGITIMYCCSICFYKKTRYRYKVINGLLTHEDSI